MSILNALGKGVMPQFSMRGSSSSPFTNVSQDMLNTAAAGEAMRQSIADKYSSDISAFTDGTAALKDIFGEKEASIEDLIPEENELASEEDGMTSLSISDVALGLLDPVYTGVNLIKGASERMTPLEISDFYEGDPMDQLYGGYGFDKSREMFDLQEGDTNVFGNEVLMDSPMLVDPEVRELYESALGMKNGGRVHRGIGGTLDLAKLNPSQQQQALTPNRLAYGYSPFMDAQQGFDYYTQFQNPTFATPAVRVEDTNLGEFGSLGPQLPEGFSDPNAVPIQKPIAPVTAASRGGGDNRPLTRFEANPTEMGFNDQGKLVYTQVNPYTTRVKVGDEVPFISPIAYGLGFLADKTNKFLEKTFVPEGVKNFFSKKEADPKPAPAAKSYLEQKSAIQGGKVKDEKVAQALASSAARAGGTKNSQMNKRLQAMKDKQTSFNKANAAKGLAMTRTGDVYSTKSFDKKDRDRNRQNNREKGRRASARDRSRASKGRTGGGFCFDPSTLVQMFDGSEKRIKDIKLGDKTKGGEVTGVFQFKAADEIHNYEGVIVAGSHYVKEDGKFIMVQDSPKAVKVDKIPVVHSLDTTGRRIWINDIEFADYNGDGIAKGFLANAGVDLTGFDQEVLRQVEHRLI